MVVVSFNRLVALLQGIVTDVTAGVAIEFRPTMHDTGCQTSPEAPGSQRLSPKSRACHPLTVSSPLLDSRDSRW